MSTTPSPTPSLTRQAYDLIDRTILRNRWIPHSPHAKQAAFLALPVAEALYGGAAGGGKSEALLMAALQYVDVPGYSAILFRRSYPELSMAGAIMDRAHDWLGGTAARWNSNGHTWTFPSGATLSFGYLERDEDKYRYKGAEFAFCGFDELTGFIEPCYRYLFSRLRRLEGAAVPLRMRGASNPGDRGHDWVFQRFMVEGRSRGRLFVPALLADNPSLDRAAYERSLFQLDPFTRAQLLAGDWFARPPGSKFRREWFPIVDAAPADARRLRYWDLAATEPAPGKDPDWTAGALVTIADGVLYVCDVRRLRGTPRAVEALVRQTAELDGRAVGVRIEQEPGSSGVNTIDHYRRQVLSGWDCRGVKTTGNKEERANPLSSAAEAGNVRLVRGDWIGDFLDEAVSFPGGAHDDQVDAVSGGYEQLTGTDAPFSWLTGDPDFRRAVLG